MFVLVVHMVLLFPQVLLPAHTCPRTRWAAGTRRLVPSTVHHTPTGRNGSAQARRSWGWETGSGMERGRSDGSAPTQSRESSQHAPCHISLKSAFELLLLIFNNQLDKYLPK